MKLGTARNMECADSQVNSWLCTALPMLSGVNRPSRNRPRCAARPHFDELLLFQNSQEGSQLRAITLCVIWCVGRRGRSRRHGSGESGSSVGLEKAAMPRC